MLAVASIVCVSHSIIGISAHFHESPHKKAKHPSTKSKLADLWWLRLVQLGFGLLCLFLVTCFSTAKEKHFLCLWLILMSIPPMVAVLLSFYGIRSKRLLQAAVIILSAGCVIYYGWMMMQGM